MRARSRLDHRLARCPVDGLLVMFEEAILHPEGQGPKSAGFRQILGNPRSVGLQRLAEIASQRPEELRTGFRHGALDKEPQDLILANPSFGRILQHHSHKENLPSEPDKAQPS